MNEQPKKVYVDRKDLPKDYLEWIGKEAHHQHKIVKTDDGVLRWEETEGVYDQIKKCGGLNELVPLLYMLGWDKNSEQYRDLYRQMGYSLFGYWEIFHWDVNNPECDEYVMHVQVPVSGQDGFNFFESVVELLQYKGAEIGNSSINILKKAFKDGIVYEQD